MKRLSLWGNLRLPLKKDVVKGIIALWFGDKLYKECCYCFGICWTEFDPGRFQSVLAMSLLRSTIYLWIAISRIHIIVLSIWPICCKSNLLQSIRLQESPPQLLPYNPHSVSVCSMPRRCMSFDRLRAQSLSIAIQPLHKTIHILYLLVL